jgi:hypothetical protein
MNEAEKRSEMQTWFTVLALGKLMIIAVYVFPLVGVLITGQPSYDAQTLPLYSGIGLALAFGMFASETIMLRKISRRNRSDVFTLTTILTIVPVLVSLLFRSNFTFSVFVILAGYFAGMIAAELLFQARGGI